MQNVFTILILGRKRNRAEGKPLKIPAQEMDRKKIMQPKNCPTPPINFLMVRPLLHQHYNSTNCESPEDKIQKRCPPIPRESNGKDVAAMLDELKRNLLLSSSNMAAMTSHENDLYNTLPQSILVLLVK